MTPETPIPSLPTLAEIEWAYAYLDKHGMPESPHGSHDVLYVLSRILKAMQAGAVLISREDRKLALHKQTEYALKAREYHHSRLRVFADEANALRDEAIRLLKLEDR